MQVNAERQLTTGDITQLSSYPYYGTPLHAVSDGTIVAVSGVLQDQTPGSNPPEGSLTLDQYGGNYVVQRFMQNGETYYAFYAHLKPGSAKANVTAGQTVKAADLAGELGNSGNTDAPHLHFHVMDAPDPLASNGLPYQFDTLELVGQATGDQAIDTLMGGQPFAVGAEPVGSVGRAAAVSRPCGSEAWRRHHRHRRHRLRPRRRRRPGAVEGTPAERVIARAWVILFGSSVKTSIDRWSGSWCIWQSSSVGRLS